MTRHEFIDLVQSTRSNRKLAERLEELGVNENLSHFVRANTAFNDGGFEQVFKECDIDLLTAELRDIPGWFWTSTRLIRQLETAREALAVLSNREATAEEKKQAEETVGKAWYRWWSMRTKVLVAFWRGVRRAPDRFYDRSIEAFSGLRNSKAVDGSASEPRPKTPLVVVFTYVRDQCIFMGAFMIIFALNKELKTAIDRLPTDNISLLALVNIAHAILIFAFIWFFPTLYVRYGKRDPLDAPLVPKKEPEPTL